MQSFRKPLRVRTGIVACACVGLLAGGAGTAMAGSAVTQPGAGAAAQASPTPSPTSPSPTSPSPTASAHLTAHASPTSVKSGGTTMISGTATGLKPGDKLTVQRMGSNGKFSDLDHVTTTVKSGGTYSVAAKLTTKGTEKLRVIHGKTTSPTVHVTVT